MQKIRAFFRGRKTYITAAVGILTALAAWSDGRIDTVQFALAVWAGLQAVFIRAGIAGEAAKANQ